MIREAADPFHASLITRHDFASRPEPAPRVSPPEFVKAPGPDRPADVRHQALVEPNIMQGNENRAKHLAGEKKVPDRPLRECATRVTVAAFFNWAPVADVSTVAQADRPAGRFLAPLRPHVL